MLIFQCQDTLDTKSSQFILTEVQWQLTQMRRTVYSVTSCEMKFTMAHRGLQAHRFGSYNTMQLTSPVYSPPSVSSYQSTTSTLIYSILSCNEWLSHGIITELYKVIFRHHLPKIPKCVLEKKKILKKPHTADSNTHSFIISLLIITVSEHQLDL